MNASPLSKSSLYWSQRKFCRLAAEGLVVGRGLGLVGIVGGTAPLERVVREDDMMKVQVQGVESMLRRDRAFYTGTVLHTRLGKDFTIVQRIRPFSTPK